MASLDNALTELCARDDIAELQKRCSYRRMAEWQWTTLLGDAAASDALEIARYCVEKGAKVGSRAMAAAAQGQAKRVYPMLAASDIAIEQDWEIGDGLLTAVHWNNAELVRFCLEHGARPDATQVMMDPQSLLGEAASESTIEIVKLLLDYGAKKEGSGALQLAATENRRDMVEFLLEQGCDANELGVKDVLDPRCDVDMGTALHKAIEGGHAELAEFLNERTDLEVPDGQGRTPIELAKELDMQQLVDKMLQSIGK